MKKLLLVIGVAIILTGVIVLLFSALSRYVYDHLLDGHADLYIRLHRRMIISLIIGIVLVVIGAVCLIIRTKL